MRTCSSGLHALYTFRKPTSHCGDIAQLSEQTASSPILVVIVASQEGEVYWRGTKGRGEGEGRKNIWRAADRQLCLKWGGDVGSLSVSVLCGGVEERKKAGREEITEVHREKCHFRASYTT